MANQDEEIKQNIDDDIIETEQEKPRLSRAQIINLVLLGFAVLSVGGLLYYWNSSRIVVPNAFDSQTGTEAVQSLTDTTEEEQAIKELDGINFDEIDAEMKGLDETITLFE